MNENDTDIHALDKFPDKSRVKIVSLDAGRSALSRLCSLGLVPGTRVEVLSAGLGPVKLRFRDSEMVIGHQLASKVMARTDSDQN